MMLNTPLLQRLDTRRVDFDDPTQVCTFARELTRIADNAGMFQAGGQDHALLPRIRKSAKEWLFQVDLLLKRTYSDPSDTNPGLTGCEAVPACSSAALGIPAGHSPAALLRILSHYDLLHRIAYGVTAPGEKIDPVILSIFQAYLLGNQSIDIYTLYHLLWSRIQARRPGFLGRPLEWCTRQLSRWHKNLKQPKPELTTYDLRNQAEILLSSDLRALEPRTTAAYRHHLQTLLQLSQKS